ncbi:MAG: magnesium transporter [Deltaproteobacteria bacterium]
MTTTAENERKRTDLFDQLLADGDHAGLSRLLKNTHPADIAEFLDQLDDESPRMTVFDQLPAPQAAEVVRKLSETTRGWLFDQLPDSRLSALVEGLDTDDATDLLGELPAQRRQMLLVRASPETRRDVEDLLAYPEDSAGGIMKTEVAAVTSGITIAEVTEYIRQHADGFHDVHNVFVTDGQGHLKGFVPLRDLILARADSCVDDTMDSDVVSVHADVDQEEVAHLFEKYELVSIPVLDTQDRLIGRITIDDIVDVIEEEATEDILRLAGVGSEPIGSTKTIDAIRARLPWLGLNLVTATLSAAAISLFEGTIESLAIAAAFMTIVASQGGNAGVQTMTLIVRGLALGEVGEQQAFRILRREILVALGNGAILGTVAASVVYLWRGNLKLSLVLGAAMVVNLLVAAALGSSVPILLKAMRIDPAVSSSVLVTAGTDILGFFIFLGLLSMVI